MPTQLRKNLRNYILKSSWLLQKHACFYLFVVSIEAVCELEWVWLVAHNMLCIGMFNLDVGLGAWA